MNGGFPDNRRGFSWKGKTLLSGIDPAGKAERVAETVPVMDRILYLCPSPLYGYGLERLLARLDGFPHSAVLCIEAEPELFALSREHFDAALNGSQKLRITDQCEPGTLCALLRQEWGPRFFRRVEMIRLNGGWQLHHELYDTLAESLRREIALDWGNAMTLAKLGRRYIRNALRNLPLIPRCHPLQQLDFGSAPALVLGAGPSLDTLLDSLQSRFGGPLNLPEQRPFRIICVDTCLTALRERGITPDLAVILESQHWNLADFIGLSGQQGCGQQGCLWNVPAALDLSALPRSAHVLSGGLFLFFTPWTTLNIFGRLEAAGLLPPRLPPLGSVGLSAAAIARQLTRGAIITAGLDFSFSLDSYHARSTPGHKAKLRRQNRFTGLLNAQAALGGTVLHTVSKTGGQVFSTPAMRNYRDIFEREFSNADSGARFFDIAGSGLPLGATTLSPEEAFDVLSGGRESHGGTEDTETTEEIQNFYSPCPRTEGSMWSPCLRERSLEIFIQGEENRLILLRDMLTGAAAPDSDALVTLIDECDYLWAHFPDYAGTDRRPGKAELSDGAALSFLKRLRVEIDPFLKLWGLVGNGLGN
jgi:hypothetical protein